MILSSPWYSKDTKKFSCGVGPLNGQPIVRELYVKNENSEPASYQWHNNFKDSCNGSINFQIVFGFARLGCKVSHSSKPFEIHPKQIIIPPNSTQTFQIHMTDMSEVGILEADAWLYRKDSVLDYQDSICLKLRGEVVVPILTFNDIEVVGSLRGNLANAGLKFTIPKSEVFSQRENSIISRSFKKDIRIENSSKTVLDFNITVSGPFQLSEKESKDIIPITSQFKPNSPVVTKVNKSSRLKKVEIPFTKKQLHTQASSGDEQNQSKILQRVHLRLHPNITMDYELLFVPTDDQLATYSDLQDDIISGSMTVTYDSGLKAVLPIKCLLKKPVLSVASSLIDFKSCSAQHSRNDFQFVLNHSDVLAAWRISHEPLRNTYNEKAKDSDSNSIETFVDDPSVFTFEILEGKIGGPCVSLMAALDVTNGLAGNPVDGLPDSSTDLEDTVFHRQVFEPDSDSDHEEVEKDSLVPEIKQEEIILAVNPPLAPSDDTLSQTMSPKKSGVTNKANPKELKARKVKSTSETVPSQIQTVEECPKEPDSPVLDTIPLVDTIPLPNVELSDCKSEDLQGHGEAALPIHRLFQPSWQNNTVTLRDILRYRTFQSTKNSNLSGDYKHVYQYPFPITITFTPKEAKEYRSTYVCESDFGNKVYFSVKGVGTAPVAENCNAFTGNEDESATESQ